MDRSQVSRTGGIISGASDRGMRTCRPASSASVASGAGDRVRLRLVRHSRESGLVSPKRWQLTGEVKVTFFIDNDFRRQVNQTSELRTDLPRGLSLTSYVQADS